MRGLSTATARRLDRLSARAHAFHRYAHHPLCGAYAGEVIRVGRKTRLCKGCTLAVCGLAVGLGLGWALQPALAPGFAWAALGLLVPLALPGLRDPSKLATRLGPALGLAALAASGARSGSPVGLAAAAFALVAGLGGVGLYRRRGPHRSPCATCPERDREAPCSGLREIYLRELAFRRLAGRSLGPPIGHPH